jgi:F0F1-type ATP synthase assembly protein I
MTAEPHLNDGWSGVGVGWGIAATMLGGILVWGGVGYLIDRLVGTSGVFVVPGMLLGAGGATYIVYLRHGRGDRGDHRA